MLLPINQHLIKYSPAPLYYWFNRTRSVAQKLNIPVFLVGGPVRDLLLHRIIKDLDFTVVQKWDRLLYFVKQLTKTQPRVKCIYNPKFLTLKLCIPEGFYLDFAVTRKEKYPYPGSLPVVSYGTLTEDLKRRDFTFNALALNLNSKNSELIDPMGGILDLKNKTVRVIHPYSFYDDPTRIWRAVRFTGRYGFNLDEDTQRYILTAKKTNYFQYVSSNRHRQEIIKLLNESNPAPGLLLLSRYGFLAYLSNQIKLKNINQFRSATLAELSESTIPDFSLWLLRLIKLICSLPLREINRITRKLVLTKREKNVLTQTKKIVKQIEHYPTLPFNTQVIYDLILDLPNETKIYLADRYPQIRKYIISFFRYRQIRQPELNGNDLIHLGFTPGPQFKTILRQLTILRLRGKLISRQQEIAYVVDNFGS